ncbi:hypothetical protein DL546_009373 [Coniochaeta pulveracea]|uniref:Uncharacterized protein n=1 Tax=Coniochaeta pulveracea TaxID=177199 RepID=A0A420YNW6_9PEZI|nr:hypothetical protein DL546_009373 [Coniochaeta pulveracea]
MNSARKRAATQQLATIGTKRLAKQQFRLDHGTATASMTYKSYAADQHTISSACRIRHLADLPLAAVNVVDQLVLNHHDHTHNHINYEHILNDNVYHLNHISNFIHNVDNFYNHINDFNDVYNDFHNFHHIYHDVDDIYDIHNNVHDVHDLHNYTCTVSAGTVNLYYWPTNRPYAYPSTYVDQTLDYTFTYPTVYMYIPTAAGIPYNNSMGAPGPSTSNWILPLDLYDVSTIYDGGSSTRQLTLSDLGTNCPQTADPTAIATMVDSACDPVLAAPTQVRKWAYPCNACGRFGLFDPPYAVPTLTGGLVQPTVTKTTGQPVVVPTVTTSGVPAPPTTTAAPPPPPTSVEVGILEIVYYSNGTPVATAVVTETGVHGTVTSSIEVSAPPASSGAPSPPASSAPPTSETPSSAAPAPSPSTSAAAPPSSDTASSAAPAPSLSTSASAPPASTTELPTESSPRPPPSSSAAPIPGTSDTASDSSTLGSDTTTTTGASSGSSTTTTPAVVGSGTSSSTPPPVVTAAGSQVSSGLTWLMPAVVFAVFML